MRNILGKDVYKFWAEYLQERGQNRSRGSVFFDRETIYSYGRHFPLATRLPWGFLINGDTSSMRTTGHQKRTRHAIAQTGRPSVIIPFSSLRSAEIAWMGVELVESEPSREILHPCRYKWCVPNTPHTHPTHLLGRSVIKAGGVYYLSGLDETMVDAWRGYFLAQLPRPAQTVVEALNHLKPPAVLEAEAQGISVKRQGEWFFVVSPLPPGAVDKDNHYLVHRNPIRAMNHRATELRQVGDQRFVRGTIRHQGHEHKMLSLGREWHSVHENMEVRSFRSSGRVD